MNEVCLYRVRCIRKTIFRRNKIEIYFFIASVLKNISFYEWTWLRFTSLQYNWLINFFVTWYYLYCCDCLPQMRLGKLIYINKNNTFVSKRLQYPANVIPLISIPTRALGHAHPWFSIAGRDAVSSSNIQKTKRIISHTGSSANNTNNQWIINQLSRYTCGPTCVAE